MPDIYAETVRKMSDYITSRLTGADDSCKRVFRDNNPSKFIIVGSLANVVEDADVRKSSVQESSITLKFKINKIRPCKVHVHYSVYAEDQMTPEEKEKYPQISKAWNRIDYSDSFELNLAGDQKKLSFDGTPAESGYQATISSAAEKSDGANQVSIVIQNDSPSKYRDKYLFNVWMEVEVSKDELIPYTYQYYYEKLKKSFEHDFRTINCTAFFSDDNTSLITSPVSVFEQNKEKLKTSDNGFEFRFDDLSSDSCLKRIEEYSLILDRYLEEYELLDVGEDKKEEYDQALDAFKTICSEFKNGLNVLKNDLNVQRAFKLMNKTFMESSEHSTWRMFQIVFIIISIPKLISEQDSGVCDVIHIPTGGGKTEVYLGVSIFLMFYSRLMGKEAGNVVIVKFPLRMLSIQQIERVATKVVFAEKIRKEESIGGYPFSTSFLVGDSEEYPNKTTDAINAIRSSGEEVDGKILKICPLCKGKLVLEITKYDSIVHRCKQCGEGHHLYFTDLEAYRYLPTLIISTVDKFSAVSRQRRIKNIFGGKISRCRYGHGAFPISDKCDCCQKNTDNALDVDMKLISQPMLIVQDELHLIRESLGSIDAHFEAFCEELQFSLSGTRPNRIAMTATITGCSEQIDQLYNKKSRVFPGPNPYSVVHPGAHKDPFFESEYDGDRPKLHRRFVGLKPNGRDNQYATNLTIKYVRDFIKDLLSGNITYGPEYEADQDKLAEVANYFTAVLTYHNKKSDVFSTSHFMDPVLDDGKDQPRVQKKSLTGDSNADEIRNTIESVKNFDANFDTILHVTSATNIVSHGVDLEKWNFMEFQGIPNNTAEYIQSRSRVGRKYAGLVFIWFYPNRVRDISFFHNFYEYHQIIDHKVEPVSINKWTKLSLYETCTSIFLGSILNYMSAKYETPIYTRAQFDSFFKNGNPDHKDEVIDFMQKVYHTELKRDGAEFIRNEIPSMVEERIKAILVAPADISKNFFPGVLEEYSNEYFGIQLGMRGIQKQITLYLDTESSVYQEAER